MKGSIIERGDALRLKVSLGKNSITGKYESYYETFHGSSTEAQKRLREILTKLDKGTFIKPGKASLSEYLQSWLADSIKPNLSDKTFRLYSYICKQHIFPSIGKVPLVELKPQQLQHLYAQKQSAKLSKRTVQIIHVVLHKALLNAVKTNLLDRNVADLVTKPQIEKGHGGKIMSEVDMHLFLEMARDTEYYALFYCYLFTGCRRSELLALRWLNGDLLGSQLSITRSMQYLTGALPGKHITFKPPKTKTSIRSIALTPSTVAVLREHREKQDKQRQALGLLPVTDNDLIFAHYDGSPLLPDSITHAWIKLTHRCGLDGVRLHDARHSHATFMLKQGVSPKVISERLGHSGIAITLDLYVHTDKEMHQAAANKFDDILKRDSKLDKELAEIIQN